MESRRWSFFTAKIDRPDVAKLRAHRNKIGIMAQTTIKSNPKGSLAVVTNFSENMKSNAYFQSLPAWVQETIQQTAITLHSEEELRQCAEKLMQNGKN